MTEQERLSECYSSLKTMYWLHKKAVGINWEELSNRYEILKDKYAQKEVEFQQALQDKQMYKDKWMKLREEMEGGIIIQVDGKKIGSYVTQEKYMKVLEKLKALQEQINKQNGSM